MRFQNLDQKAVSLLIHGNEIITLPEIHPLFITIDLNSSIIMMSFKWTHARLVTFYTVGFHFYGGISCQSSHLHMVGL